MTIIVRHNEGDTTTPVTETRLEGVMEPELWAQAFFRFRNLSGDLVWMVPVVRVSAMKFEDNAIKLA